MLVFKKYYTLNAFTVLELVVGMVISSLIVAMTYYIYANLSKQMHLYTVDQNELMVYNQFQNQFSKDIKLSKKIKAIQDNSIMLDLIDQEVTYQIHDTYIVRVGKGRDTFNIKAKYTESSSKDRIHEGYHVIKLPIKVLDQDITFFEEKQISLAEQINQYFLSGD